MVSGLAPPTPSPSSGHGRAAQRQAQGRGRGDGRGESAGAAADVDSAGGLAGGAGSEGDGLVKISGFQQTGFQHEDGPNIQVKIK